MDVADVYAAFSDGVFDPAAIRDYVAYAAREMGTRFVLLVGADTFDYQDNLGLGSVSFIPSLYVATGPIVRFAPADPLFADVDGDRVPDLADRPPAGAHPRRARAVIDKILLYEGKGYGSTALFVADAPDAASGFSFSQAARAILRGCPGGWSAQRAYVDSRARRGRTALFRPDRGGAPDLVRRPLGAHPVDLLRAVRRPGRPALTNDGEPTVMVQWGCWNTYHVEPRFNTLGHRFLLAEHQGAAAVLGSATLLETSSADALLRPPDAAPGAPGDHPRRRRHPRQAVPGATQPGHTDAILGWTLLGDPALTVD